MNIVREKDVETLDVPGRKLKWLFHPKNKIAEKCSMNVVEIMPGETVKPAHSHPKEEEIIYVVSGCGKVLVDNEVEALEVGTSVLFKPGSVHMVSNDGSIPLKLVCFFAPPAELADYQYHENIGFP